MNADTRKKLFIRALSGRADIYGLTGSYDRAISEYKRIIHCRLLEKESELQKIFAV